MARRKKKSTARKTIPSKKKPKSARALLREVFRLRGYLREPDSQRRGRQGQGYKKGYEVRLGVSTRQEIVQVRKLLREAGLKPGKDYEHHNAYVIPLYGLEAVAYFRSLGRK